MCHKVLDQFALHHKLSAIFASTLSMYTNVSVCVCKRERVLVCECV